MQPGDIMTGQQLQDTARKATEGHSQSEVAEKLGVSRSTVAVALTHKDVHRYKKTLSRIIEEFADLGVEVRYLLTERPEIE